MTGVPAYVRTGRLDILGAAAVELSSEISVRTLNRRQEST